ncbi:MAG: hypothetical protein ACR2QC_09970 [Gammaproteobacteria bacterium]
MRFRAKRFRLSPEWRYFFAGMAYFIFSDTAKFGIVRKDKKHRHSGESRNLFNPIPAKAGISSPKAVIVAEGVYNFPPLRGGGDSCLRRNGTVAAKIPQKIAPKKNSQKS